MVKVGDRVRVSGRTDWANGLEGTVNNVDSDVILVHFEDARRRGHGKGSAFWYVNPEEVTLVSSSTPLFKVGDKVRATDTSDYPDRRGKVGVVASVDDDSVPYLVDFEGTKIWFRADELDAYIGPTEGEFVVVTDGPSWMVGRVGVIEKNGGHLSLVRIPGETTQGHGGNGMGDGGVGKWWLRKEQAVPLSAEAVNPAPTEAEIAKAKEDEAIKAIVDLLPGFDADTIERILISAGEHFDVYPV